VQEGKSIKLKTEKSVTYDNFPKVPKLSSAMWSLHGFGQRVSALNQSHVGALHSSKKF